MAGDNRILRIVNLQQHKGVVIEGGSPETARIALPPLRSDTIDLTYVQLDASFITTMLELFRSGKIRVFLDDTQLDAGQIADLKYIVTLPATTERPGLVPALPGDPALYFDGTGTWTDPGGGSSIYQDVACLSSDAVGSPVCVRDDRLNGKWRVETADPFDLAKMPAIGVLISKSTPTVGVIQLLGACEVLTGLDWTRPYYFVGSGGVLPVPPLASSGPTGLVYVQQIGKAVAADRLLLNGNLSFTRLRE